MKERPVRFTVATYTIHKLHKTENISPNIEERSTDHCLLWNINYYYILWMCDYSLPLVGLKCLAIKFCCKSSHKRYNFLKKCHWTWNMYFVYLYKYIIMFSHSKKNRAKYDKKMCIVLHVKYLLFFHFLMKLQYSRRIFEEYYSIRFHEFLSGWSRFVA